MKPIESRLPAVNVIAQIRIRPEKIGRNRAAVEDNDGVPVPVEMRRSSASACKVMKCQLRRSGIDPVSSSLPNSTIRFRPRLARRDVEPMSVSPKSRCGQGCWDARLCRKRVERLSPARESDAASGWASRWKKRAKRSGAEVTGADAGMAKFDSFKRLGIYRRPWCPYNAAQNQDQMHSREVLLVPLLARHVPHRTDEAQPIENQNPLCGEADPSVAE